MKTTIKNITIIGSGNVATHIASALHTAGFNILEVCSATPENAGKLARKVQAHVVNNLKELSPQTDLFLLSVSDKAYEDLLANFPFKNKKMVHTAGSLPMNILSETSNHHGVFYPFQTLSKHKKINFKEVPLLVSGSDDKMETELKNIAESISNKVDFATDEQRKYLHISAVFACNFTNLMYSMARTITEEHGIDFSLLNPLIKETAAKVKSGNPKNLQTGPAVRNDQNIISGHLEMLKNNAEFHHIYKLLTETIIKHHHKDGAKEL